jgi:phage terminase large subunit-like protein
MDYENPWIYLDSPFTSEQISDHIGFVYKITNINDGRFYIGKKLFTRAGRKKVKGKTKKIRVESDWMKYYSSSDELNEDVQKLGKNVFRREILRLCKSKSECTYYEAKYQFELSVLLVNTYNKWIQCKIRRNTQLRNLT